MTSPKSQLRQDAQEAALAAELLLEPMLDRIIKEATQQKKDVVNGVGQMTFQFELDKATRDYSRTIEAILMLKEIAARDEKDMVAPSRRSEKADRFNKIIDLFNYGYDCCTQPEVKATAPIKAFINDHEHELVAMGEALAKGRGGNFATRILHSSLKRSAMER